MKRQAIPYRALASLLIVIFLTSACQPPRAETIDKPNPAAAQESAAENPTEAAAVTETSPALPGLVLPFEDNFNNGLRPEWTVAAGTPFVLDGRLTPAGEHLQIEIGGPELTAYTLEFDPWGKEKDYCGFSYFKYLTVNFSPTLRLSYNYVDYAGRLIWQVFESGDWKELSRYDNQECGRFRVIVADNKYQVFILGQLVSELVASPAAGPLSIGLDEGVTLDNLVIK